MSDGGSNPRAPLGKPLVFSGKRLSHQIITAVWLAITRFTRWFTVPGTCLIRS